MHESFLILDFGSQYTQLIARRLRELNVYCEIHPYNNFPKDIANLKGLILSGGPSSVKGQDAPDIDLDLFWGKVPILGVCYGAQLIAHKMGGEVIPSAIREYGRANIVSHKVDSQLLKGIAANSQVWMSHGDTVGKLPTGFHLAASTSDVANAAFEHPELPIFCIQFHPEVTHSTDGLKMLKNFVADICKAKMDWTPAAFVDESIKALREKIGDDQVVLALSGGVDSSVAALLLHKAIGENLHCIFVDNGLLRKGEYNQVLETYEELGLNVEGVNASAEFLGRLEGVSDPEKKRKIIGNAFIDIFDEGVKNFPKVKWLAQGTIYPDVIESISVKGPSATIKSHHNVGGLPDHMNLKVVEPLRMLFKDEVRRVGKQLGLDERILKRHPFPGPGLAIRILGAVTAESVRIIQEVDAIFIEGLKEARLYDQVWQAGAIYLPVKSVGVMGDERTYESAVCLRAVSSTDGMTADWCHLPHEFLGKISNEIINKVKGVNRVVYDISSKPPATIEWE